MTESVGPTKIGNDTPQNPMRRWEVVGALATLVIVLAVPLRLAVVAARGPRQHAQTVALYVGSDSCKSCHQAAYDKWRRSHHALAMTPAREDTVLGDFNNATFTEKGKTTRFSRKDGKYVVSTEGPDGKPGEFEVAYTFGWFPLQQYLIPFPGGRLQSLTIAWDVPKKRWFSLYPDQVIPPTDWLYWTRPAQNWNVMCSECHSTGVRKRYDPERDTYQTTWSEISVGCEACHGPGSLHAEWAKAPAMARLPVENFALTVKTSGLANRDLVNLCAPCHARRSELRDLDRPGGEPLDSFLPVLLTTGLFYPDGQILEEDYEYHSFLQSKMYANGVKCSDCHDVHSAKRLKEGNDLCLRCHRADTYDTETHHFHKKVYKGKPSEGASCAACHMPGRNYMGIHFRRDHSLRVPRPDLSVQLGTPNACSQSGCHADKPLPWAVQAYNKWYGVKRKPHYGTVLAAARERKPEARGDLLELAADRLRPAIVRATALDLLWTYPGEESTRLLQQALTDEDALIRRTAAHHVPVADPKQLLKVLAPLLKDSALAVRIEAVSRLAEVPQTFFAESQARDFKNGLDEYRKVLAYTADMPSGRYNWGILEQNLGRPDLAEQQYRKALAIDDQFFLAQANLALLLSRQGKNAEAEQLLRAALRANPRNAAVAFNLGLLLAEEGKAAEAESALRTALKADPQMAPAAYNLAVLVAPKNLAEALELSRKAADLRPEEPRYAFTLAFYQRQQGNAAAAITTLQTLLERHPAYGEAYLLLGEMYVNANRVPEARQLFARALEVNDLPDVYRTRIASLQRNLAGSDRKQ
jgi:predicted CXXCH cytochrome family protein